MRYEHTCEICGRGFTTYNKSYEHHYCSRKCYLKRKFNTYKLDGEFGVGYTSKKEKFYFDLEDYNLVESHTWYLRKGYPCTNIWVNDKRTVVYLHNMITDTMFKNKEIQIDHINKKRFDCRKSNLRTVNDQENARNRGVRSDNSSGVSGVGRKGESWIARIQIKDGKRINLYYGSSLDDAIKSRLQAELEYFGEFAPQKHLFEEYGIKEGESSCQNQS